MGVKCLFKKIELPFDFFDSDCLMYEKKVSSPHGSEIRFFDARCW